MGFAKAFVLVQLSLLLVSTSTVFSEDLDIVTEEPFSPLMKEKHHPPPFQPPNVKRPRHPPVPPPFSPPTVKRPHHPPFHYPRSFLVVQGVVYCKSCKYAGVNTLLGASPVLGAIVKLQCNNSKYPLVVQGKTDKNGYFYITAPKTLSNYGAHKCKVSLLSSPIASCSKPSDLLYGSKGAILRPEKQFLSNKLPFVLYTVGPFAFEPKCPR